MVLSIGAGIAAAIGFTGIGATIAGFAISAAIGIGISALTSKLFAPKIPDTLANYQNQIKQLARTAVSPVRWILGRQRVSGVLQFWRSRTIPSADTKSKTPRANLAFPFLDELIKQNNGKELEKGELTMVVVLSEGEIDGIEEVWIDGEGYEVTGIDENGNLSFEEGEHQQYMAMTLHTIPETATSDQTYMQELYPQKTGEEIEWSDRFVGTGLSFVIVRLFRRRRKKDQEHIWDAVPNVNFLVRGNKITWPGQDTPMWTDNAVANTYWYLVNGLGVDPKDIDENEFQLSFDVAAEEVSAIPPDTPTTSTSVLGRIIEAAINILKALYLKVPRYTVNTVVDSSQDPDDVLEEMKFAMNGEIVEWQNKFYIRAGYDRPIETTITEEDIIELVAHQTTLPLNSRINEVTASCGQSINHDWSEFRIPAIRDEAMFERDGVLLPKDLGVKTCVAYPSQLERLLTSILRVNRSTATWQYKLTPGRRFKNYGIKPSDFLTVTDNRVGLDNTRVFVNAISINEDFTVDVTFTKQNLNEYSDSVELGPLEPSSLDWSTRFTQPPPPTNLQLSYATDADSNGNIQNIIKATVDPTVYGVRWELEGEGDLQKFDGDDEQNFVVNKLGNYTIRAWNVNRDGFISEPIESKTSIDAGDLTISTSELIPINYFQSGDILTIHFKPILNRSIKGIEVRANIIDIGSSAAIPIITTDSWEDSTLLDRAPVVGTNAADSFLIANVRLPRTGKYRLFARSVDFIGDYSDIVEIGTASFTISDTGRYDIQWFPNWPGALKNMAIDTDNELQNLIIDDTDYPGEMPYYYPTVIDLGEVKDKVNVELFLTNINNGNSPNRNIKVSVWETETPEGYAGTDVRVYEGTITDDYFQHSLEMDYVRFIRVHFDLQDSADIAFSRAGATVTVIEKSETEE